MSTSPDADHDNKMQPISTIDLVLPQRPSLSQLEIKKLKKGIWKNVLMISTSFLFLFTSYNSMSMLQSSINPQMGTLSLSALYVSLVLSCLFVPTWLINKLHEKKTIAICMLGYSVYILAQFYPRNFTLIPGAVIVGICAAPLWSAKCTYLTKAAKQYGILTGVEPGIILNKFFGVFFLFFQSSNIVGNLISSTVLKVDAEEVSINDTERLSYCGANYCQATTGNFSLDNGISRAQRFTMSGIYLIISLLSSLIVAFLVDPVAKITETPALDKKKDKAKNSYLLVATFKHFLENPYQILIFPLTIWSGVQQAFFGADFTAAYVSCGEGVYMVGYVIIVYGTMDAIGSLLFSMVVKKVGRVLVFTLGAILNFGLIGFLFVWRPSPDDRMMFFWVAGLWGVADSIWQTQTNAFYGLLFAESSEAAFSNYRLWESVGFALAYLCSTLICVTAKLYILLSFLSVGMLGYYLIEVNEKYQLIATQRSRKFVLERT